MSRPTAAATADAPPAPPGSPWPGALAAAALPLLLALDLGAALLRGWQPERLGTVALIATAALLAVVAAALLLPAGRRFLGRNRMRLTTAAATAALALGAAEIALRLLRGRAGPDPMHCQPPGRSYTVSARPGVLPGIEGESRLTFNSLGLRGPELPADRAAPRILCVGGSTTLCVYLDDEATWTHGLMRRLSDAGPPGAWTAAAALNGCNSVNHRMFLERSQTWLAAEIDVVVCLVGWNDLTCSLLGLRDVGINPAVRYGPPDVEPWSAGSAPARLLRSAYDGLLAGRKQRRLTPEDVDGSDVERSRALRRQAVIVEDVPDPPESRAAYRAHIRGIVAACRAAGVRIVLVTQPTICDPAMSPRARDLCVFGKLARDGSRYASVDAMRRILDDLNDVVRRVCAEDDAELVDAAAVMNGREEFFYDDCHFNRAGAERLADLLADHFRRTR